MHSRFFQTGGPIAPRRNFNERSSAKRGEVSPMRGRSIITQCVTSASQGCPASPRSPTGQALSESQHARNIAPQPLSFYQLSRCKPYLPWNTIVGRPSTPRYVSVLRAARAELSRVSTWSRSDVGHAGITVALHLWEIFVNARFTGVLLDN